MDRIDKEQGGMWTPKPREATGQMGNAKSFRCKIFEPLNQPRTKEKTYACRQ
jgi:hypothetical protein